MGDLRTAVVLGDGQMAADCAKLIAQHEEYSLAVVVHHESGHGWSSQIAKFSKKFEIPHVIVGNVNDDDAVEVLKNANPHVIFSVNNWDIIHPTVLAVPTYGIINFHNGPLPAYRGVNIPSWAIINRERVHGVTWHLVTEGIDSGDIVAETEFELRPEETAISLTFRCIQAGVALFKPLLDQYAAGKLERRLQGRGGRYYSIKDTPNDGYLDFTRNFEELSALVRGLTFRPFDNQLTWPKIQTPKGIVLLNDISFQESPKHADWVCGEVSSVDDDSVLVCAGDGQVRLSGLMNEDCSDITGARSIEAVGVKVGEVLHAPS